MNTPVFRLEGLDTFSMEEYPIDGTFASKDDAFTAAKRHLRHLERTQPSSSSGGQHGIQDRVYVVTPEGARLRVLPEPLTCPDGGTCHHYCQEEGPCYRVLTCGPLSGVYPNDEWPAEVLATHGGS